MRRSRAAYIHKPDIRVLLPHTYASLPALPAASFTFIALRASLRTFTSSCSLRFRLLLLPLPLCLPVSSCQPQTAGIAHISWLFHGFVCSSIGNVIKKSNAKDCFFGLLFKRREISVPHKEIYSLVLGTYGIINPYSFLISLIYHYKEVCFMAYCKQCGNELMPDSSFCSYCGASVPQEPISAPGRSVACDSGHLACT